MFKFTLPIAYFIDQTLTREQGLIYSIDVQKQLTFYLWFMYSIDVYKQLTFYLSGLFCNKFRIIEVLGILKVLLPDNGSSLIKGIA